MLVPWVNAALTLMLRANARTLSWQSPTRVLLTRAAFSFAILLSLWGATQIARRLGELRSRLAGLAGEDTDPMGPFHGIDSTAAPLILTAATVVVFGAQAVVEEDWSRGIVAGGAWLFIGLAMWTFFWAYLKLQIGLHRLGRRPLSLEPYPGDRSLGLRPVGRLAFTGFWTFVAALAPLLVATGPDRFGLSVGLLVLLGGVAAFFLSLRRLNRQMVAAKERELTWVRYLYAQAFRPVREAGTLEALQHQASLLSAAEALEKRAERIQEWPFDEGMFTRVVAISSTVVAAILARLLLAPFGI
jgi:hypothetical protein